VAAEIRQALDYIAPEQLILTSDCGFGREGCPRNIALYKAAGIAQGANIVRQELGATGAAPRIAQDLSRPQPG
jgi:5-methyltetrahydropteroyltriglutamate--homocysteine methyltransferase